MIFKNYKHTFLQALSSLYDEKEIESFFYLTLEKLHQKKRIDLALQPDLMMDEVQLTQWETVLAELKIFKPIQYILGDTEFYGLPFLVNENVLIPRPETEELVELILVESRKSKVESLKILDIGTGSGCIPVSLKKNLPSVEVFAIDVSTNALEVAQKNAEINGVEVNFIQTDILKVNDLKNLPTSNSKLPASFDIIVSNPPYVRNLEKAEINPNVLEFEPHLALFVEDNDALLFYRKITELAKNHLSENGKLYFEINQYLGKETVVLIESYGFKNVLLIKDIYGNDRMISASYS
ncbi:peptide chain release factor N(5)-glutamine methyltransferase [Flavobacterium macrobrachii]|uniref:Release factor glutamine methyltransferase n=1 Tax=Flavobacterium macrobrachii TaxID=591204 RepID=A0ABS2CUS7_9FLAO|nr:peptide chain release factor N(5)-glutamine methyltransferase [Flavobacterium macrobrachii]MBM6498722.1 peptide chain release factor N(5)-glutamine methyltransferase [Flavobacterium macrobrachii]